MSEGIAQGWVASATCGDGEIEGPGLGEAGILISGGFFASKRPEFAWAERLE